ncbi:Flp1 family type IVb pilin [Vallitalea okinawensis]|uniref:Flp1 family type IVb pilin n=1 Tax=Vallitalea okinawensis TaxID=2078660 RepID=UPI000CFD1377|nr:Flp1 family type IVb pilin [Vallitalea okinawensis]
MLKVLKDFWQEEEGLGTLEIVLILVVILAMAVIFKSQIAAFFNNLMSQLKDSTDSLERINSDFESP